MDLASFIGGVVAALTGVCATVLVTEKIEEKKHSFESQKALSRLYIELASLQEECSSALSMLQDTYYRGWRIEKGIQADSMWDGLSIPKAPSTIVLDAHIEKSLGELTSAQVQGIKTIRHLCKNIEVCISSLMQQVSEEKINLQTMKYCISVLCALYHLSLNMAEHKSRFIKIDKIPADVQDSVLSALDIDLSFDACAAYQPAI
ncbi:hypothetical protein [Oceanimonas sp. GK1]|uniref:hypothetical protein n=1 Tax=Oceanimonas sp. (strain GK1 / IBRC-M 10197) TaxID=511062 RepID=UPI0011D1873A|nr:hypothetical protein [Oceanimonas sp. GK1]